MKRAIVRVLLALVIMVASGAVAAAGAEKRLPLQEGRYVLHDVPCDKGTIGDRLYYYKGSENNYYLGLPHGEGQITQVSHKGKVYHLTLRCTYKGVNGIVTEKMTLLIKSNKSFSIIDYSIPREPSLKGRLFRWCDD